MITMYEFLLAIAALCKVETDVSWLEIMPRLPIACFQSRKPLWVNAFSFGLPWIKNLQGKQDAASMLTEYSIHEYFEYHKELNVLARPSPNFLNGNWANLGWTGAYNLWVGISRGCSSCCVRCRGNLLWTMTANFITNNHTTALIWFVMLHDWRKFTVYCARYKVSQNVANYWTSNNSML